MSQNSYATNRLWSNKFLDQLKMVSGLLLFRVSSKVDDTTKNTDLIVLVTDTQKRIACRVRRYAYFERYPNDVTIRSANNGHKTEFEKIMEGWGDYLIYAFANQAEDSLEAYRIINLNAFRSNHAKIALQKRVNGDGTEFVTFNINQLPRGVLVTSGGFKRNNGLA